MRIPSCNINQRNTTKTNFHNHLMQNLPGYRITFLSLNLFANLVRNLLANLERKGLEVFM